MHVCFEATFERPKLELHDLLTDMNFHTKCYCKIDFKSFVYKKNAKVTLK